jgi:hypothetical protein
MVSKLGTDGKNLLEVFMSAQSRHSLKPDSFEEP